MTEHRALVVTGGGSGIGRAVARLAAGRGYAIAVLDRNAVAAEETAVAVRASGGAAIAITCDVGVEADVARAFAQSANEFGPARGVFANAGIEISGFIHEMPLTDWNRVLTTNLTGVFLTCKYGLQQMIPAGRGSIVCTSSPTASVGLIAGGLGAYSSSKGGISSLVRCMAVDYAKYGIRVNAVVPGSTETGMMWANVAPADQEAIRAQLNREIPLARLAQPEDPAYAVLWLLSDEAAYATGSHLVCDGGILAKSCVSV